MKLKKYLGLKNVVLDTIDKEKYSSRSTRHPFMSIGSYLLGFVLFGLLFTFGIAYYFSLMITQSVDLPRTPINYELVNIPHEKVSFQTIDGYKLVGWWFPLPESKKHPIIITHGLAASKDFMFNYVTLARKLGFPVFAYDLRGHGESDRSSSSLGYYEQNDLRAAIDFVESKGFSKVILWGLSLGGVTSLEVTATDSRVAGVIADAPFDTLRNTIAHHAKMLFSVPRYPLVDLAMWIAEQRLNYNMDNVDSTKAIPNIHVPLFLIAAEKDTRMPPESIKVMFDQANEPKSFYIIPNETHSFRNFDQEFQQKVEEFLSQFSETKENKEAKTK